MEELIVERGCLVFQLLEAAAYSVHSQTDYENMCFFWKFKHESEPCIVGLPEFSSLALDGLIDTKLYRDLNKTIEKYGKKDKL